MYQPLSNRRSGMGVTGKQTGRTRGVRDTAASAGICLLILIISGSAGAATAQSDVPAAAAPAQGRPSEDGVAAMRTVRGRHIVLKSDSGSFELLREWVATFD